MIIYLLFFLLIFFFGILFVLYLRFENTNLEVTSYNIQSDKIPKDFDKTKFVVLTDLHNNSFGRSNQRLINRIYRINPDFILIAGDMMVGQKDSEYSVARSLILQLAKTFPIYYSYGNHEQRAMGRTSDTKILPNPYFIEYKKSLEKQGVKFLLNESAAIQRHGKAIKITGIMIDQKYFKKFKKITMEPEYLPKLAGELEKQYFNILLAHNPDYFRSYAEYGADLTISGHLHGGIVRLPFFGGLLSPQYRLFPKYDSGEYHEQGKTLLVSRGLGMHTIKVRVWNRPELMVFTLNH